MSRHEEYQPINPTQRYYDWRSDDKSFCFWDASSEQRYAEQLPWKFYILRERICVRGFDENTQKQVFSNEIRFSNKEVLNVRWADNIVIAKGLWKDIKEEVKANGGQFTKIIYAMTEDLEIVCIRIKGNGLLSWGDVVGKAQKRQQDEWISVSGYDEKTYFDTKTGQDKINSFPLFTFGGSLSTAQDKAANELYEQLKEYFESKATGTYATATPAPANSIPESQQPLGPIDDDDDTLPF